jgi:hypothetical protein
LEKGGEKAMDRKRRDQIAQKIEEDLLRTGPIFFIFRQGPSFHEQLRQKVKEAAKRMGVPQEDLVECVALLLKEDA